MAGNGSENATTSHTLAGLVQQYGEILAHGGEGSTPSQLSEPRAKLRTLLLRLLDLSRKTGAPRDLAAVVQLLKLTFDRLPWVTGGTNILLLELLDRLIPLMTHPFRKKHQKYLLLCIKHILVTVSKTEKNQFVRLVQLLWSMFEGKLVSAPFLAGGVGRGSVCGVAPSYSPLNYAYLVKQVKLINGCRCIQSRIAV